MSHLHLTDGMITPVWCALGYVIAAAVLALCVYKIRGTDSVKRAPLIGLISALMLLTMSVPLGFLPFHLNLTVLLAVIAGPYVGFIAVLVVNFILSLIGHGGITVVGINSLIIGIEVFLGYALFSLLGRKCNVAVSALAAVVVTLLVSTSAMVGTVLFTNTNPAVILPHEHYAGELHGEEEVESGLHDEDESLAQAAAEVKLFSLSGIVAIAVILLFGIILEAAVTMFVVSFLKRTRPDLILKNAHRRM